MKRLEMVVEYLYLGTSGYRVWANGNDGELNSDLPIQIVTLFYLMFVCFFSSVIELFVVAI